MSSPDWVWPSARSCFEQSQPRATHVTLGVELGIASLLRSGHASPLLIISVLMNPVDAIRTGALLGTSGTTAFGSASLAFLRFTKGTGGAAFALSASIVFWTIGASLLATRRLKKRDL